MKTIKIPPPTADDVKLLRVDLDIEKKRCVRLYGSNQTSKNKTSK